MAKFVRYIGFTEPYRYSDPNRLSAYRFPRSPNSRGALYNEPGNHKSVHYRAFSDQKTTEAKSKLFKLVRESLKLLFFFFFFFPFNVLY
jgi:hypothetical protein